MADPGRLLDELGKLNVEQLKQVKEQYDGELSVLQDSLSSIRTAATRFEMAAKAVHQLSLQPPGKELLVPLTASLYAPGRLADPDTVLVDVGTGYYIQKTLHKGKDYCERKIQFLKANYDKLIEVASEKKLVADQVNIVLQAKVRQANASVQEQQRA
eukprot:TRINITY_DN22722_c0_g1_i1.p1 TRINITY_DN22722_c0_g1~~TRINITY_DN22722_c0_g1_i1.p1  ORF type:complete len:157 (+),score=34.99 TRINITY_DN22722_c0_g1_i1:70-540(+)